MKNILHVLETAVWVFIAMAMLLFVLGYLILNVPGWLVLHPQYPAEWEWYIIWGIIGAIVLFMALLWWWWGSLLNDREEARRIADSMPDDEPQAE
jgi:hypothetical protein